ncbi:LPXTG cell wall anchor domain-containing protein [Dactylosporangium sp. NPDC051541]|uniref:LPXTG cell wall anchor domain-containing protein n=1 Tax=Dactylosporangium sp. NPDC051541 TaxID=3363977 RepID=UPI00378FEC98
MNSVYHLARGCGVALALGLGPIIASVSPAAAAPAAAISFADRCDGGVDVTLANEHDSGNVVYAVGEDVVVVAPGQRSLHPVAAPAGGDPLVVTVVLEDRDGQEKQTAHTWEQPGDCDDAGDGQAAADSDQYAAGAPDGYGPDGDGFDFGLDSVGQGVSGQAANAEDPLAVSGASATGALPVTGSDTALLGGGGVLLVLIGAGMVRLRRRRITFEAK